MLLIVVLGLLLRVGFILNSDHVYHPDEIFQTLDPAYHLVYAYGLEPCDYTYGLRSYLIPIILSLPLIILKYVGISDPSTYTLIIKFILAGFSLLIIPTTYLIIKTFTHKDTPALLGALVVSFWYELVYFAPRAFSETLAIDLFCLSILAYSLKRRFAYLLTGVFFGLGILLRPPYFILGLVCLYYLYRLYPSRRVYLYLILGFCLSLGFFGLIDSITLGFPFISLINFSRLGYLSSLNFGTDPFFYYLFTLIITSCGLVFLTGLSLKKRQLLPLTLGVILLILLHSLIPHKEYRYILVVIPLYLIILISSLKSTRLLVATCLCVSLFGYLSLIPNQFLAYPINLFYKNPLFALYPKLKSISPQCGLYLPHLSWVMFGGYYRLGLNLPIYTADYPPPSSQSADLIFAPENVNIPTSLTYLGSIDRFKLWKLQPPCVKALVPSTRSFAVLGQLLKSAQTYPYYRY